MGAVPGGEDGVELEQLARDHRQLVFRRRRRTTGRDGRKPHRAIVQTAEQRDKGARTTFALVPTPERGRRRE